MGTYGEMMREALAINSQEEADKWFVVHVDKMQENNPTWSRKQCENTVRSNLGYMAGYYDEHTAKHVYKFWGATHPIFGGHNYHKKVTPEEAFKLGKNLSNE